MRCFVALWPDEQVRARLDDIAREAQRRLNGGRRIPAANLHLTVAFIGELEPDRAQFVADELADLRFVSFEWHLDHIGCFIRARVVWAAGPQSDRLLDVASDVRTLLNDLEVDHDPKPFVPHVTLLRDAPNGAVASGPLTEAITWSISRPMLLTSEFARGRPVYRPVA